MWTTTDSTAGSIAPWLGDAHMCDLDFAFNVTLIDGYWSGMQQSASALTEEANKTYDYSLIQTSDDY